ncbi:MAG: hypothetical protein ACE3JK_02640 [Sporolactobacillus sp.]
MQLNNPIAKINSDPSDPGTVQSVTVTAQISELFERTTAAAQEIKLTILPSEYDGNMLPDALVAFITGKIKDRLTNGQISIFLKAVNYNSASLAFATLDSDTQNVVGISGTYASTQTDLDTAMANGRTGLIDLIKNALIAEFIDTTTTTTGGTN